MDDWVVVEVARSEPEAELLCSVLHGAGIECLPRLTNSGAGAGDGLGTVGAHDIMVSTPSSSARSTRAGNGRVMSPASGTSPAGTSGQSCSR
jgi:hypothetical protein